MRALAALIRFLAWTAAFACALGALAAQGGRWSDRLDILTHFAPLWLGGAVAAALLWLLSGARGKATPVLASIAVGSSALLMYREFLERPELTPAARGAETLTVIQANVWGRNPDPKASAGWILSQDPDVVVLEEAFGQSEPVIQALRRRYPHQTSCAEPRPCSTVILAKRPPRAEGGLSRPDSEVSLFGAWATYDGAGGPYTVVGVHFTRPYPAGPQQAQTRLLAEELKRFPKARLIVAGDFNSTPWSFALERQDAAFGLERRTRALATWPAREATRYRLRLPRPVLPIDHIYAGEGWETVKVMRGPRGGSDHYPVLITLQAAR